MLRLAAAVGTVWILALGVVGCSGEGSDAPPPPAAGSQQTHGVGDSEDIQPHGTVTPAEGTVGIVTIGESALYAPFYRSLDEMTRVLTTVIVGRVTDTLLPYDPRPGFKGLTPEQIEAIESGPKGRRLTPEELSRPPGRGFSVYSVEVVRILSAKGVAEGDVIGVLQSGGTFEGTAYQREGDPVLESGSTYVFFLEQYRGLEEISEPEPWGPTYSGPPYGRFIIGTDGTLAVVDERRWACVPCEGPRAIIGQTLDRAEERVVAAARGDLGDVDLAPPYTPTPAPAPDPTPVIDFEDGQPTIIPQEPDQSVPTPSPAPG